MSDEDEQPSSDIAESCADESSQSEIESNSCSEKDDVGTNPDLPFRPKRKPISPRSLLNKRAASISIYRTTGTKSGQGSPPPLGSQLNNARASGLPTPESSQPGRSEEGTSQSSQVSSQYFRRVIKISPKGMRCVIRLPHTSWLPNGQQHSTQVRRAESVSALERYRNEPREPEATIMYNRLSTPPQASVTRHHSAPPPGTSEPPSKLSTEASIGDGTADLIHSKDAGECLDEALPEQDISDIWTRNPEAIEMKPLWVRMAVMGNIFQSDLGHTEKRSNGYVYVFQPKDPRFVGFIKIGYTFDLVRRLKEHKNCYGDYNLLWPPNKAYPPQMYHALRVQRLAHTELSHYAYDIPVCPNVSGNGTPGPHKQWFKIEADVAIGVIKKWTNIMNAQPYEECLVDSGSPAAEADEEDQDQQSDREGTPMSSRQASNLKTLTERSERVTERYRLKLSFQFNENVSFSLPSAFVPYDQIPCHSTTTPARGESLK